MQEKFLVSISAVTLASRLLFPPSTGERETFLLQQQSHHKSELGFNLRKRKASEVVQQSRKKKNAALSQASRVPGSATGFPVKKSRGNDGKAYAPDPKFEIDLQADASRNCLSQLKKIELSCSLMQTGRATTPPQDDFTNFLKLFSTKYSNALQHDVTAPQILTLRAPSSFATEADFLIS
ncbi:MAG: hypothetical protein M1812_003157 [Candelaria pacifica]|nr:MAG: hypothetical protein M1812_003157 [Candelaria pacifica]